MSLTKEESKSLKVKEMEYKELLKKSVQLTYILLNMNPNNIKSALHVYMNFISNIQILKQQYQAYERINDFDLICQQIIQVFITQHKLNFYLKHQSKDPVNR